MVIDNQRHLIIATNSYNALAGLNLNPVSAILLRYCTKEAPPLNNAFTFVTSCRYQVYLGQLRINC